MASQFVLWIALLAQAIAPPAGSPQESRKPGAEAAYVVEQSHVRVRFEASGAGRRELSVRIKVLDEQAVRAWGEIPFPYSSDTEELTFSQIEVRKPDGSVVPTAPATVQDLAVRPFGQQPIFMALHQKVVAISALRPGDVLAITAIWTTTQPLIPDQFAFAHSFNTAERVLDERLEIDVPANKPVLIRVLPGAPVETAGGAGEIVGGRRIYRWKTSNLKPSSPDDQNGDDEEKSRPDVR
jgi:hypothetical protein